MIKGFVFFRDGKIPFVLEDNRMEMFTDDELLGEFCKTYNFKQNYVLEGQCFQTNYQGQKATFLVQESMGGTCYLKCYILYQMCVEEEYDAIGLQSLFLDDVFRYQYHYFDGIRQGINFDLTPKEIYQIPFSMGEKNYELSYCMGHDNRLGMLEDLEKKGEILIDLQTKEIQECFDIVNVFYRLAMFMISVDEVPFKRITLYHERREVGWFLCPLVSRKAVSTYEMIYYKFDVKKYIPKILNNIALDSGNAITQSIPLGHLGTYETKRTPRRFMEQIVSFEYLFDKLDHKKAQDTHFPLKEELKYSFNLFPGVFEKKKINVETVSEKIKELRRKIAHGYEYYYDFGDDIDTKRLIYLLDELIRDMSLKVIGFTEEEITDYGVVLY